MLVERDLILERLLTHFAGERHWLFLVTLLLARLFGDVLLSGAHNHISVLLASLVTFVVLTVLEIDLADFTPVV